MSHLQTLAITKKEYRMISRHITAPQRYHPYLAFVTLTFPTKNDLRGTLGDPCHDRFRRARGSIPLHPVMHLHHFNIKRLTEKFL
jgi:hypothetical protein